MKYLTTVLVLFLHTVCFASEGGDLISANVGTNIREGNTLNAPVIRTSLAEDVFYRLPGDVKNGFAPIKLKDGTTAWIYEKYTYRLVDKDKTQIVTATPTTKG